MAPQIIWLQLVKSTAFDRFDYILIFRVFRYIFRFLDQLYMYIVHVQIVLLVHSTLV